MVKCKLSELMGEHQILKISTLAQDTGINRNTLTNMYYDRVQRIEIEVVDRLCAYFTCSINDLFEYQDLEMYRSIFKKVQFIAQESHHDLPFSKFRNSEENRKFVVSKIIQDLKENLLPSKGKALLIVSDQAEAVRFYEEIKSAAILRSDQLLINTVSANSVYDQDDMTFRADSHILAIVVSRFGKENGISGIDRAYIHKSLNFNQVLVLAQNMSNSLISEVLDKKIVDFTGLFSKSIPSITQALELN